MYVYLPGKSNEMSSFSEGKLTAHAGGDESAGAAFVEHTRRFLVRTYPAGARVDSSNYSPLEALAVGAQMVALNFQTRDLPLESYLGLFRDNNASGFVLKPPSMLTRISHSLLPLQFLSASFRHFLF